MTDEYEINQKEETKVKNILILDLNINTGYSVLFLDTILRKWYPEIARAIKIGVKPLTRKNMLQQYNIKITPQEQR